VSSTDVGLRVGGDPVGGSWANRRRQPCGTRAAYVRHERMGEVPCQACRDARNAYERAARKSRSERVDDIPHGTINGYINWGCRCKACLQVGSQRNKQAALERRERIRRGEIPAGISHGATGYQVWSCRCAVCRRAISGRTWAREKRKNDVSRDFADRHGQEWTGVDLELLTQSGLTLSEKAKALGRTIKACKNMLDKVREKDPLTMIRLEGHP